MSLEGGRQKQQQQERVAAFTRCLWDLHASPPPPNPLMLAWRDLLNISPCYEPMQLGIGASIYKGSLSWNTRGWGPIYWGGAVARAGLPPA